VKDFKLSLGFVFLFYSPDIFAMQQETEQQLLRPPKEARVTAGAVIQVENESSQPGFSFGFAMKVSRDIPLYLGGNITSIFVSDNPSGLRVAVLPTVHLGLSTQGFYQPVVGLSLGPVLGLGQVEFAIFIEPGVNFKLTRRLFFHVESRVGFVGGEFVAIPFVGASFVL
jgi:hypothetical protein